jgi:hypothetical protein
MKAGRTQARVYKKIQTYGSEMLFARQRQGETRQSIKGLLIENATNPDSRWHDDVKDIPFRSKIQFLVGVPPEPRRNVDGDPVDSQGNLITIPEPDMTRLEYVRWLCNAGKTFDCVGVKYTVLREIPLPITGIPLYLIMMCDHS